MPPLRRQLAYDLCGIIVSSAILYGGSKYFFGASYLHTFAVWLVLQWFAGSVLQWRAHVEHYGLWGKGRHYFETQTYSCRNLRSNKVGHWYFNYLNFHLVHHAFPRVPFYHLGTAHKRFMALYEQQSGYPWGPAAGLFRCRQNCLELAPPPDCHTVNRDGRTCQDVRYSKGQSGYPWGRRNGRFRCESGCLILVH